MKRRKIEVLLSLITISVIVGGGLLYNNVYAQNDVKVTAYKSSKESNEKGYQITKYKDVRAEQWIDENKVLVLKDNGKYNNPDADISMSYISICDLNTKEYIDYKNINMDSKGVCEISKDKRYVLYEEPRNIPKIESKEWEEAINSGEIFKKKIDILDLETGEMIENFDNSEHNYEACYRWVDNNYIFADYGSKWRILNKEGQVFKEGSFDFTGCDGHYSSLISVDEIKIENNTVSGKIYYTKEYRGNSGACGYIIYTMDLSTLKENALTSNDECLREAVKGGSILAQSYYNNNGDAVHGIYVNRTFGFKLMNEEGNVLQDLSFPKDRDFQSLRVSPKGDKCAFIEGNDFIKDEKNTLSDMLKVMDIKTGEIKEITTVDNLMDKEHEENFRNIEFDGKIHKGAGPVISIGAWDSTGTSLLLNYEYTSKDDGENYMDTYVITFDK